MLVGDGPLGAAAASLQPPPPATAVNPEVPRGRTGGRLCFMEQVLGPWGREHYSLCPGGRQRVRR